MGNNGGCVNESWIIIGPYGVLAQHMWASVLLLRGSCSLLHGPGGAAATAAAARFGAAHGLPALCAA
jgi:hypothetical protein